MLLHKLKMSKQSGSTVGLSHLSNLNLVIVGFVQLEVSASLLCSVDIFIDGLGERCVL